MQRYRLATARAALLLLAASLGGAQDPKIEKLAPYYPTPMSIVAKMLDLAGMKKGEKMFDLGSGDGRIVIMAAQKYGAIGVGVEFDKDLVKQSTDRIRKLGLEKRANIILGDAFAQDYSSADVLTIYLLPNSNEKLRPLLDRQLRKGTRVVAHDFEVAGWRPDKTQHIDDDGEGRSHTLYLYNR